MSEWTITLVDSAPNPMRASSSPTTTENWKGAPMPPHSSGTSTHSIPALPRVFQSSRGTSPDFSQAS